jgi:hypothetical protein
MGWAPFASAPRCSGEMCAAPSRSPLASLMHTITMRDGIGEPGSHGFVEISAAKCRLGVI